MVVYNRASDGSWSSSSTGQSPSSLGYSGARSSSSAPTAVQAAGGQASQNNAVATQAAQKVDWGHHDRDARAENAADGMYGESAQKAAQARGYTGSGGSSSGGGNSPVVVTAQPHITPEISEAAKQSGGNYTIKGNSAQANSGNEIAKAAGTPNNPIKSNAQNYPFIVNSQTRTVEDGMINPNVPKPSGMEIYQQTLQATSKLPLVGSTAKTIETVTINPKTGEFAPVAPFVYDVTAQRLNEWNEFNGSGKERAAAGMDAALNVGLAAATFGTGALVGAGVKGVSLGLGKAAETKVGQIVIPKLTTPLIKGEGKIAQQIGKYSTPLNIGLNSAAGYSIADTSVEVGKKFAESPGAGVGELAKAAISAPLAIAGGGAGYKLTEKAAGAIKTRGLTYIPAEKYTVEGIPLSNQLTQDNLAISFEKNIFYPKPDKFAETNKAIQDVSSSAKLPKHPSQTVNAPKQMYHASNKPFGKEFEVIESESEIKSIMYGAPKAETYFTRISGEAESKPGLLFNIEPSTGGEILNLKGTAVKKVDYDIAARDLDIPIDKIKASPNLQYKAADYYIQKYGKQGEFYIPGIKAEYEAGTKAGTRYKRLPARYYTEVNGIKVRISEYEPVLTETAAPKAARGNAGKPQKVSYTEYSGKPQKIPVSYSLGVSSKLQTSLKESSRRAEKTTKQDYSSRLGKPSVRSYSDLLGDSKRRTETRESPQKSRTASGVESISSIVYGGKSQRGISSTAYTPKKRKQKQLRRKRDDKRGTDIDFYSAAHRGRIDHLSIVDPLEFLGRGSMTNRKRADMTLYKQKIYLVDSDISLTKPTGRRRK